MSTIFDVFGQFVRLSEFPPGYTCVLKYEDGRRLICRNFNELKDIVNEHILDGLILHKVKVNCLKKRVIFHVRKSEND